MRHRKFGKALIAIWLENGAYKKSEEIFYTYWLLLAFRQTPQGANVVAAQTGAQVKKVRLVGLEPNRW